MCVCALYRVTATPPAVSVSVDDNTVVSENVNTQSDVAMETVEYAINQVVTQEEDIVNVVDDIPGGSKSVSVTITESVVSDQKDVILKFAEQYSISQASSRFKVPTSTIKKWMKSSPDSATMLPKFNLPGQGRKLSYSTEKDESIASHIRDQLGKRERVTLSYVSNYAKSIIQEENPQFIASSGWAQRFLIRHSIDLSSQSPSAKRVDSAPSSESRGRPLTYSTDTDRAIADYVRSRLSDGQTLSNSELRRYAKEVIGKENPNFTGSASWAQNFLLRHKIALQSPIDVATPTTSYHHTSSLNISTSLAEPSLHPAAEITPTTSTAIYPDIPTTSVAMDTSVDDTMKTALAILTGENIDSVILSPAQAAALQSSLSELTTDTVSLVDLLNNAQQLSEQGDGQVALITHGLESPSGNIYLGLGGNEAFGSGLSGPAATQVNPNTQTPLPTLTAHTEHQQTEMVTQASRPLSYTKETDNALADWVQEQQAAGKKVTFASLRAYAKKLISTENPNFNASVGWVTPFLLRHNLDLNVNKKKKTRKGSTPRKISSDDPKEREEDGEEVSGEEPRLQTADAPIITPEVLATAIATSLSEQGWSGSQVNTMEGGDTQTLSTDKKQAVPGDEGSTEVKPTPKIGRRTKARTRHTLAEKLEVVRLMKEHNLAAHHVCRMLGIANSTYAGWTKLVQQKGAELEALSSNKKRANVSGQGRPLSYSRDKDEAIADWVRSQQQMGVQVTPNDLAKHATTVISQENFNFTASSGWQQKFLQRHNLQLTTMWTQRPASLPNSLTEKVGESPQTTVVEDQQSVPAPVQTEEVISNDIGGDKPYSDEIEEQLIQWVKEQVEQNGSLAVQVLCKKAEDLVIEQNPVFVATLGWAFKFLHRHSILLDPKPSTALIEGGRKRASVEDTPEHSSYLNTPKKLHSMEPADLSVSPSTGNLCEALLALSNQAGDGGEASSQSIQAAVQSLQNAMQVVQQQQAAQQAAAAVTMATPNKTESSSQEMSSSSGSTYFGKPAREFTSEEKEEVVRYANATTLQKAALKYGVAAPTVWRWRVELKLHQPKYTTMQKKYIIKFAETNSLKEASQRYGITGKTIQNWRKALQAEGELPTVTLTDEPTANTDMTDPMDTIPSGATPTGEAAEVVTYDNQNFQFIVDGGEVVDTTGKGEQSIPAESVRVEPLSLEVTNEVDIENVGMEYDVVSSEGHAAKPRCTPQEKLHILQYALEHSVREASQKFGISPGTLYYWKKSMSGSGSLDTSSATLTSTNPNDSIMTVEYSGMSGDTGVLQGLRLATSEPSNEQFNNSTSTTVPIASEAIQTLPADINFLQAVSSLLSSSESGGGEKQKTTPTRRHDSASGGISSPTEVLVPPFQSANQTATEVVSSELETTQVQEEVEVSEQTTASSQLTEVGEHQEVATAKEPVQIETEIENISQTVELSDSVPTTNTSE